MCNKLASPRISSRVPRVRCVSHRVMYSQHPITHLHTATVMLHESDVHEFGTNEKVIDLDSISDSDTSSDSTYVKQLLEIGTQDWTATYVHILFFTIGRRGGLRRRRGHRGPNWAAQLNCAIGHQFFFLACDSTRCFCAFGGRQSAQQPQP